ncbi:hypothetical protein L1887_38731 [Cichorium endivia]|nr:hypothetical protein L1887_38731 [Cichorium endivia]
MVHWCSRAFVAGGGGAFAGEAAIAGAAIADSNNAFTSTAQVRSAIMRSVMIGSEEDDTLNRFPDFVMVMDVCMERETVM